jgi:tetratricopeptide (TPR) repeat protein
MNRSDDVDKARRLVEIDQRYMMAMPNTLPGQASEAVVAIFESIRAEYEALIQAGPPSFPLYTVDDLLVKVADVTESIARTYDSLRNDDQAAIHYERAAEGYARHGHADKAERCRNALAQLRLSAGGNINDELQRLQKVLAGLTPPSLDHARTTLQLAELYSAAGDDFEAEEHLKSTEQELQQLGHGNPGAGRLADALTESMTSILSGNAGSGPSTIEIQMLLRDVYKRMYLAYAQIYRATDPDAAAEWLKKAEAMDSGGMNQQFTDEMMKSLGSLLNRFDRNTFKG